MPTVSTEQDEPHLRRALELAEEGRGRVSPNPLVGAVLVREDQTIGEGFHAELGGLHAERAAIAEARQRGEDPAGSTIYLTLEPCAHTGRQPPCTEAILEAGISRVVYASEDPTEKASGRGPGMLRDGGVAVELAGGPAAAAARRGNPPLRTRARPRRPRGTDKARAVSWSTAGGPSVTPSPSASGQPWPTIRCSPPGWKGPRDSPAGSSTTPTQGCPLAPLWSTRSTRRR